MCQLQWFKNHSNLINSDRLVLFLIVYYPRLERRAAQAPNWTSTQIKITKSVIQTTLKKTWPPDIGWLWRTITSLWPEVRFLLFVFFCFVQSRWSPYLAWSFVDFSSWLNSSCSKNSPQCLHLIADIFISSAQYGHS